MGIIPDLLHSSLPFNCLKCGRCCRGRGGVWLDDSDRQIVADYLSVDLETFTRTYLEADKSLWLVKNQKPFGYCSFFKDNNCEIHDCKPFSCRLWPFFYGILTYKSAFLEAKEDCPALSFYDYDSFLHLFFGVYQNYPPKSIKKFLIHRNHA
jgi:Fe-S-cluster containining protein